ncbi:hypothetical protein [Inquilinus limosus]|uniref:hypothetical protein n=1 Tax=Inquilinus limosus TaxID=171674 RepID=UPI001377FE93|nr:hypothetical protein [Inquilinus limosus]
MKTFLIVWLLFAISGIAGMAEHLIYCIKTDWIAMLLVGLFIPPVGVVHGLGLLLGAW